MQALSNDNIFTKYIYLILSNCLGMLRYVLMLRKQVFFFVWSGCSSQIPGVLSPHELLRKLQLVQHEQRETSSDPPRPCPGLAPRFLGPTQALAECPAPDLSTTTAIKKAAMQIPVSTVNTLNIPFAFFRVLFCEDRGETVLYVSPGDVSPDGSSHCEPKPASLS